MVDFYGFHVGKYTSHMDSMEHQSPFIGLEWFIGIPTKKGIPTGEPAMNEDVSPIKNGDLPASHISFFWAGTHILSKSRHGDYCGPTFKDRNLPHFPFFHSMDFQVVNFI